MAAVFTFVFQLPGENRRGENVDERPRLDKSYSPPPNACQEERPARIDNLFVGTFSAVTIAGASALSVTMGAHRLYTHRTFKCNDWVRALLVFGQTIAGQVSLFVYIFRDRQRKNVSRLSITRDLDVQSENESELFRTNIS